MSETITCQGRTVDDTQLAWLRDLLRSHPDWSRHRITLQICEDWNWRTHAGRLKTFAARSFIDKLEGRGLIELPPIRTEYRRDPRSPYSKRWTPPDAAPVETSLDKLTPLCVIVPEPRSYEESCFGRYLAEHHYLGFNGIVGQNMRYLVRDRQGRDLACLLFGSAAWKTAPRDAFIGWNTETRTRNLNLMTNNTRFLILPWVRVPHLASHILALVTRRLKQDWIDKYAHPVHLVETFVQQDRFKGTCYRAANWIPVGQSQGRSRQDRHHNLDAPVKNIYVYPLTRRFKEALANGNLSC